MSRPNNRSPDAAARLLKGSAVVFAALGGSITAWGLDKWIRYPETRASQFGFEAPLWPAFVVFVVAATTATVMLLWTAARRAEAEDDPN
jgi:hypothetical protein